MGSRDVNVDYHSLSQHFNAANIRRTLPMSSHLRSVPSGCRLPTKPPNVILALEARSLLLSYILPITQCLYWFRSSISTYPLPSSKRSEIPLDQVGFGITFGSLTLLPFTASCSNVAPTDPVCGMDSLVFLSEMARPFAGRFRMWVFHVFLAFQIIWSFFYISDRSNFKTCIINK